MIEKQRERKRKKERKKERERERERERECKRRNLKMISPETCTVSTFSFKPHPILDRVVASS